MSIVGLDETNAWVFVPSSYDLPRGHRVFFLSVFLGDTAQLPFVSFYNFFLAVLTFVPKGQIWV